MAVWGLTKQEVQNNIETLLYRLNGQENVTYRERQTIGDAINAAMVDICMDYGVSRWRFLQSDETVDTTANTAYVDLTASVFNIISGTVRIAAENATLNVWDLEMIYRSDPDANETGMPTMYALDSSGTAGTMRLQLWPTPDAVYTIAYVAETIMDEDGISSFPSWLHAALKDRSTELALRDLGFFTESIIYRASYQERLAMAKASQGTDAPMVIGRVGYVARSNLQRRAGT